MARAVWTGSLSFGLVNVPVSLYSATEDKTVHFHEFADGTSDRIRNKRVNERTGKEVDYDDIVKGYEFADGKYVLLTRDELEEVEPGRSRTIEISDFVEAAEIDPIHYRTSYYLAPAQEDAARAYALLRDAMDRADRIAIASFVFHAKQYLAAIRPDGKALVLETMYFADEVRKPEKVLPSLPGKLRGGQRDMDTAIALIESMTSDWKPESYQDTYRKRVLQLIRAKSKGREVVREDAEPSAEVVGLLEALRKSVEVSRGRRAGTQKPTPLKTRAAEKATTKKAAAKKTAAKKTVAKKTPAKKSTARRKAS
jgi:DNA end-binding protein Ku